MMVDHFPHPNLLPNNFQHATENSLDGRRDQIANSCAHAEQLQKFKHAGIIRDVNSLIIESKWGEYPVMQHSIWDVPLSYGSDFAFYALPTFDKIESEIDNIILD